MRQRLNLSFNLKDEEQKKAYEKLASFSPRKKTPYISQAINAFENDKNALTHFDTSDEEKIKAIIRQLIDETVSQKRTNTDVEKPKNTPNTSNSFKSSKEDTFLDDTLDEDIDTENLLSEEDEADILDSLKCFSEL